ncbi:MAG: hypothetical protein MUC45_02345 [Actinomycetia bacterium]|nr:hypothetical protein [Actinomycetes bacterium]
MPAAADLGLILRSRGFRLLLGTRLLSQAADGALQAGLASYVLFAPEREATAGQVATAFAVLLLPYSVVGPFAGVLLDRWRRQRVLVRATLLRAGLVAGLAVLVLRERAGLDVLLLSLLVLGVNRFFLSALSAALPHVVSGRQLVVANALAPTAGTIATTLGAACGLAVRFAAGGSPTVSAGIVAAAAAGAACTVSAPASWRGSGWWRGPGPLRGRSPSSAPTASSSGWPRSWWCCSSATPSTTPRTPTAASPA